MKIIQQEPNPSGAYPSPQDWNDPIIPEGCAAIPDDFELEPFLRITVL